MSKMQNGFVDLHAAADFLGPGAVETPMFEAEITDLVRRKSVALQRLPHERATGHPHRFFEETAIHQGSFIDPRNMGTQSAGGSTRVEKSAPIKAIINQTNISMFDKDVTEQQGQFASVVSKDINDVISGVVVTSAAAVWAGTDTSLTTPTTLEYMGILRQITLTSSIASGASIIDGLKSQVAAMVADQTYDVRPTAIYLNPVLADYIDQEAKANSITLAEVDVAAGVTVNAINTQAGRLPLISDPYIPSVASGSGPAYGFSDAPAGQTMYLAVIVTEDMVEIPYISGATDNPNPRIFELGLTNNLSGQFVAVLFDAVIAKGPGYAHALVAVYK